MSTGSKKDILCLWRFAKERPIPKETCMSVAKIIEISSESPKSFEDAIHEGIARASKTVRNIKSAWIKEQQVVVNESKVVAYRVDMMVTFVLND
jgi:dodecin